LPEDPPWDPSHGWRVLDPDGNIVASGPGPIELQAAASFGDADQDADQTESEEG
jgi:hypothetical protein